MIKFNILGISNSSSSDSRREDRTDPNKGILILDATYAPSDISFPMDISLETNITWYFG